MSPHVHLLTVEVLLLLVIRVDAQCGPGFVGPDSGSCTICPLGTYKGFGDPIAAILTERPAFLATSAEDWSSANNRFTDVSGNARHGALTAGTVTVGSVTGNGAGRSMPFVQGTTATRIYWPGGSLPPTFTICSITRYTGGANGRILDCVGLNWLHGHWGGKAGSTHYNFDQNLQYSISTITNWVVVCGRNTVAAGAAGTLVNDVVTSTAKGGTGNCQLDINNGEQSNWQLSRLYVWNTHLSDTQFINASRRLNRYVLGMQEATCVTCPANTQTVQTGSNNITDCICNIGYTGPNGGPCTACASGTFKNITGTASCTSCPANTGESCIGCTTFENCSCNVASYAPNLGPCLKCPPNSGLSCRGSTCTVLTNCTCNPGFTGPNGDLCTACPAGSYKISSGNASCTNCTARQYSTIVNATTAATCLACPVNSDSPIQSFQCTCNLGYSGPNSGTCTVCPAGTFKNTTGSAACTTCPQNTYSSITGALSCISCPVGFRAPNGSSASSDCCPPNSTSAKNLYYALSSTMKTALDPSQYRAAYVVRVSSAPELRYRSIQPNPPAFFSSGGYNGHAFLRFLKTSSTAGHRYLSFPAMNWNGGGTGNTVVTVIRFTENIKGIFYGMQFAGPSNVFELYLSDTLQFCVRSQSTQWTSCCTCTDTVIPIDVWLQVSYTDNPSAWPRQTLKVVYVSTTGTTVVLSKTNADAGAWGVNDGYKVVVGYSPACAGQSSSFIHPGTVACDRPNFDLAGFYLIQTAASDADIAVLLETIAIGTQILYDKSNTCQCDTGFEGTGHTDCKSCGPGKYKHTIRSVPCSNCGGGTYSIAVQATTINTCTACPQGYGDSCIGCTVLANCSCNVASYGPNLGPCLACPPNSGLSCRGCTVLTGCTCNPGFTGPNGGPCTACPAGSYKISSGNASCTNCTAQQYSTIVNATTAATCLACPVNSNSPIQSFQCTCNLGYSGPNSGTCTVCPAGAFKNTTGSAACTTCPQNTYSSITGASTCISCPVGFRSPNGSLASADCCHPNSTHTLNLYQQLSSATKTAIDTLTWGVRVETVPGLGVFGSAANPGSLPPVYNVSGDLYNEQPFLRFSKISAVSGIRHIPISLTIDPNAGITIVTVVRFLENVEGQFWSIVDASKLFSIFLSASFQLCLQAREGHWGSYAACTATAVPINVWLQVTYTYNRNANPKQLLRATYLSNAGDTVLLSTASNSFILRDGGTIGPQTALGLSSNPSCSTGNCNRPNFDLAGFYFIRALVPDSEIAVLFEAIATGSQMLFNRVATCACNPGFGGRGGSNCQQCVAGKYKHETKTGSCLDCPANRTSAVGSTSNNSCGFSCPIGQTGVPCAPCVPGTYKETIGIHRCTACQPGYTSPSGSTSSAACVVMECEPGYTGPLGGPCDACAAGKFKNIMGSDPCIDCAYGTYSAISAASTCLTCPANSAATCSGCSTASSCICNAGYSGPDGGPCPPCASGKYKNTTGPAACTSCPSFTGMICALCPGSTACTCTASSGGTCTACVSTSALASTSSDDCVCGPGQFDSSV
jgi:hypothetical protein